MSINRRPWVEEESEVLQQSLSTTPQDLQPYIWMVKGILDSTPAWNKVMPISITNFDPGNTKTNTLYWLATRP